MKSGFKLYGKWLASAIVLLVIAAALIGIGLLKDSDSKGSRKPLHVYSQDTSTTYISFNTNYAKPGSPLVATVVNPPNDKEYKFTWYINNEAVRDSNGNTYVPKNDDLEKFISVVATGNGKGITASLYCSKLPVIYIDSTAAIGDEYVTAQMAVSGNEQYTTDNSEFYYGDIQIKLRGNSTRLRDKRPYKISLSNKCNLFNMGASKHWVLLANDIDHSLIRNKLVYDFSGQLGMDYMDSINVSVILNNSYVGVYQLCEQIRIGTTRINITDWDDIAKEAAKLIANVKKETEGMSSGTAKIFIEQFTDAMKKDLSWISEPHQFNFQGTTYDLDEYIQVPNPNGGYLLEMDFYNFTNISSLKTNYEQPLYFNTPEPEVAITNEELMENARKYMQSFEYALHSYDFIYHDNVQKHKGTPGFFLGNDKGWSGSQIEADYNDPENDNKHYSQLFDMDSLVNNFLVCEFAMNWDSMKNSMFISKDVDGLAKISPVWDFDWAFGNDNMFMINTNVPEGWHTTNNYFTNEQYYQSVQWNRYLIRDPYFLLAVYNKYKEIRPTIIEDMIKDGGTIDTYYIELKEAGEANDRKWDYSYWQYGGKSFKDSINFLKSFITTRISWMDKQFESFDTFLNSIGYYNSDDSIQINKADANGNVEIKVTNSMIKKLKVQVNGASYNAEIAVTNGTASLLIPVEALKESGKNIINVIGLDSGSNYITKDAIYTNDINSIETLAPLQNYKVY